MRAKRVVLINNRSLLAAGVQKLLQGVDGLELSIEALDDPELARKLRKRDPGVIVLDSGDASIGDGAITQVLKECPKAKVVALNLDRTAIDVYRMQRVLQTDLNGLLGIIRGK